MEAPHLATVRIVGLAGLPEVQPGDDLVALALDALARGAVRPETGDVFVYTQKIVSKAEDRLVALESVTPSPLAAAWSARWGRDARATELALREAVRIVRMDRGVLITETRHGFICANSGVDTSNVRPGVAALLPIDPDGSARRICVALRDALGVPVGVIVSDTFGRPWRDGQVNVAIGVAGVRPILDYRGGVDTHGQPLRSSAIAIADELASAAELVMGKTRSVPLALVQGSGAGTAATGEAGGRQLLRARDEDLFR